ncbi:DoxX family protein [Chroococcidiopsidales cyanobacterium LEGE 13417]|nr:DoxX family protein [Chroococcidiopsidales cyanobacterium LEGE 13417]
MIYKIVFGVAIALLLASYRSSHLPILNALKWVYIGFPAGIQGWTLLLLRVSVGVLFVLHGYPKTTHLRQWASSLHMPIFLCFLSALSMLGGGICLILGLLTPLASIAILGSMAVAMFLEISQGLPFVARDPYLIPEGQYQGPKGKGEPPSWEKAFMYCVMLMAIAVLGPGPFSLDAAIFK